MLGGGAPVGTQVISGGLGQKRWLGWGQGMQHEGSRGGPQVGAPVGTQVISGGRQG
jgi:hypothetical protein